MILVNWESFCSCSRKHGGGGGREGGIEGGTNLHFRDTGTKFRPRRETKKTTGRVGEMAH